MKITTRRQLYFQPILFKTISFHHQSQYFLEFQVKYRQSKEWVSAYPTLVDTHTQNSHYYKKKLVKPVLQNKVQSEKFLILFNDQSVNLKGGAKFIIQNDRDANSSSFKNQCQLRLSLYQQHLGKDDNEQVLIDQKGKIEKVGEQIICINLNITRDYSSYSSFRHIMFTTDEYFSSFLFYIDFVHLGVNILRKDGYRLDQLSSMTDTNLETYKKQTKQKKESETRFYLREILGVRQLKKLYKLLIFDRLQQFKRIVHSYKQAVNDRIKYMSNYQLQQPERIDSFSALNKNSKQVQVLISKDPLLNLNYMEVQNWDTIENQYFFQYYQTDNLEEIYQNLYQESKVISRNIQYVWRKNILLKLNTLPEEFQHFSLKFKIDKMRHITQLYSVIDEEIYGDEALIKQRIKKHRLQRVQVCDHSKFYNKHELKHPMITFHSQKVQNIVSNTSQKDHSQILVVLVHGYRGSQRDMAKIKSFINTFTSINFLPLQTLKRQGEEDISSLGRRGAQEVKQYLTKKPYISSISFIGFSLGGILAKSILSNLSEHKQKFNLFLSLSSPHLGITEIENCVVHTGVLFLKKFSKVKNIKQLFCEPHIKNSKDITLLSLSELQILSWFNHVVLIGSNEDCYVPKYSSLLAYNGNNKVVEQIQQNTLKSIKSLDRVTVWFEYKESMLQKITHKKGHISFIEDDTFLEYIIIKYLEFF